MRRMKGSLCALALGALLPACALAVTEGVVEEAPAVELELFTGADAGGGQTLMNGLIERGREVAGAHLHRGGTSVCPRIIASNGDRLGLRMDGVTGKIYALELYSLGEERSE